MATLSDEAFMAEAAKMIDGKPNDLIPPTPVVAAAPVVEAPPVIETPAVEPVVAAPAVEPVTEAAKDPVVVTETPIVEAPAVTPDPVETQAEVASPVADTIDYKGVYDRLFGTPFKAAGQEITVNTPEEAISLMQKGAGFHSKMNRMQGDLKIAEMVKNNGISESQLSLLIDAQAGKPGAIKKLLDSAKLDPLTLDSAEASSYAPSDHRVTDEQVRFKSVVSDLTETTHGTAIIQDANTWDQGSKSEIFKTPEMLALLAQQKESGVYDRIKSEVGRQRVLGYVPPNESFLQSYSRVGQQMQKAGAFGQPTTTVPTPTPVAQKVITPAVPANAKAAATAAPTKGTAPVVKAVPETKGLSDEDFGKFMQRTYNLKI